MHVGRGGGACLTGPTARGGDEDGGGASYEGGLLPVCGAAGASLPAQAHAICWSVSL